MPDPDVKWVKFDITKRIQVFLFDKLAAKRGCDVFFVQVGANDGASQDPVNEYVKKYDWPGLAIEPVDEPFVALAKNYADHQRVECVKAACAEIAGELAFFRIKNRGDLPSPANKGLSSLDRNVIRGHFESEDAFKAFVEETTIAAVPLDRLLEARNIAHVDLLVIDTEGADLQVLQGFDLGKYAPDLVMIEHYHLSDGDRQTLHETMHAAGYQWIAGAMDAFFFKPGYLSAIETDALAPFRTPFLGWTWGDNHKG